MKRLLPILLFSIPAICQAQMLREDVSLSDPAVLADPVSHKYYMIGTSGSMFVSDDLNVWDKLPWALHTGDIEWVGYDHKGPSPAHIWAPELYYRDGKYYNIVTFTHPTLQIDGHSRRSIHILWSDKAEGPYTKIPGSDEIYLPENQMCLDGSIWEEDGHLYLIYSYEWIQSGDGGIEYIELKPDLTGTMGSSVKICNASDGRRWNDSSVTDGPFIFRTQTGRLGMIWTSWHKGNYVQGIAYSDNGKLSGNWTHGDCATLPDGHGHGMLFRNFEGELIMAIHDTETWNPVTQKMFRAPEFFTVDDTTDELRAVMKWHPYYGPDSPSDVVVLNSQFDYSTAAWTCNSDAVNKGIASNQSGVISGNFYENWSGNGFTGEIYQEIPVPDGTYMLTAAAFRNGDVAEHAAQPCVTLFANAEETEVTTNNPAEYSVKVYVTDGKLKIGLRCARPEYKWMGFDNVRVTYFGADNVTDRVLAHDTPEVYFRNVRSGRYLVAGRNAGTVAAMGDHAMNIRINKLSDGRFALDSQIHSGGENHYVNKTGYMNGTPTAFEIALTDDGDYTITADGENYWGHPEDKDLSNTMAYNDNPSNRWEMLTRQDLINELTDTPDGEPADATFLIEGQGFGAKDMRVQKWKGTLTQSGNPANMYAETTSTVFNIYQTLTGIPNGYYELRAQGFYRDADRETAVRNRLEGTDKRAAWLYANTDKVQLKSIFDEVSNPELPENATVQTEAGRIPDTEKQVSNIFTNGLYQNAVVCNVTDNKLTLGVKTGSERGKSGNWTAFDNFELYYYGNQYTAVEAVEARSAEPVTLGIYDLMGRAIDRTHFMEGAVAPGIYIVDGRKCIVR